MRDDELDRLCPLPPPPDALPRVLGRADATARGYTRNAIGHRLASGAWQRVLPRTYLTSDTFTDLDRLRAALVFAGDGATLSGAAGLFAAGVRKVRVPTRILVLVPPRNRTRSAGFVQVRSTARPITPALHPGPRHVEVARAAADLALASRRLDDVRAVVSRVVSDRHCTVEELGIELREGPRQCSGFFRRALEEVGWGAASAPEGRAIRILRRAGITAFEPNFTLELPDGSTRVVDAYWPHLHACLEIDSVEYHFEPQDWSGTWDRHLDLSKFGYSVIHRPPSALRDERRFVTDVAEWLRGREADLRRGLA